MTPVTNKKEAVDLSDASSNGDEIDISTSTMLKSHRSGDEKTETKTEATEESAIIVAETEALGRSKRAMLLLLGLAAVGASLLTFFFTSGAEYNSFSKQADVNAFEIQADVGMKWHTAQLAIANLATSISSAMVAAKVELPSFQMPFFKDHSQDVVEMSSGALAVGWGPIMSSEEGHSVQVPITHLYPQGLSISDFDLLSDPTMMDMFLSMVVTPEPLQTGLFPMEFIDFQEPHTTLLQPVTKGYISEDTKEPIIAGIAFSIISWNAVLDNVLPLESGTMVVVVKDSCDDIELTYELEGPNTTFVAYEDMHDTAYDDKELIVMLPSLSESNSSCQYYLHIYPTQELESAYLTARPWILAVMVFTIVSISIAAFVSYDKFVNRRQEEVLAQAARSSAIVASLFPSNVRDRILQQAEEQADRRASKKLGMTGKNQLKSFLSDGVTEKPNTGNGDDSNSKPIADLFPCTTVMFADIAGFTAWSSIREPCQVFELLETLYNSFDDIASRRRVFKVETIGDCYVAVCGLPEPRKDHATTMVRFARDLLQIMSKQTRRLEISLGPDTGDLSLRIGLHSGPVTAGVLRGQNCRFQLFGDTVNTAARMESNGMRGAIHISEETANLVKAAGKDDWLIEREDKIIAKGKGQLNTFFVTTKKRPVGSVTNSDSVCTADKSDLDGFSLSTAGTGLSARVKRLVTFNADLLGRLLKAVVARRDAEAMLSRKRVPVVAATPTFTKKPSMHGGTIMDEVQDILTLPKFNAKAALQQQDPKDVVLSDIVLKQIHDFVMVLATMYRKEVVFHNFEHASHVTMSVSKLLSRIVAPDAVLSAEDGNEDEVIQQLHEHTYGITSDPMTQFAAVLSALIHDVDHTGVPNSQLVKEGTRLAELYKNKSVAEQNSIELAWDLLMDDQFKDMRAVIFTNEKEEKHFRALLVNLVLATDICDKELGAQRKARWAKAFSGVSSVQDGDSENRKATIVLEHLIQASDVAHTMQHWHIYRKWNEKFFEENMQAFRAGRADKNPSQFWYEGELGFFDFYIIPLAKKLKECGVFGVASDEYLDYAEKNRKEWQLHGQAIVDEMSTKYLPSLCEDDDELSCGDEDDASESAGSFDATSALVMEGNTIFNVNESWELLRRIPNYEEQAGTILFSVLFDKCPAAKVLFGFPIGMDPKSNALMTSKRFLTHARYMIQMLDKALALLGPDAEALAEILAELGKKHVRLGVKEDFFPVMGEALMETLHQMLGEKLTNDMKDAWVIVYDALSSEMIRSMSNDKAVIFSWNKLKQMENYQEVAGVILFRRLFEVCPESKVLFGFSTEMDTNSEGVLSSRRFLTHAAYFIEMLDKALGMVEAKEIGNEMKRLGQMHVQFGVKEHYFELMGDCLFLTLEEVLKHSWNHHTEEAWRDVYGRLASQMIAAMRNASGEKTAIPSSV